MFDGGTEGETVFAGSETGGVFASFPCVAASMYLVHCYCHRLVRLFADRAEAHGARNETLHDLAYWFHIFDRNGFSRSEGQEISEEDWCILFVYEMCVFLELLVATQTGCLLEG